MEIFCAQLIPSAPRGRYHSRPRSEPPPLTTSTFETRDRSLPGFRAVPRTGVIYVMHRAFQLGFGTHRGEVIEANEKKNRYQADPEPRQRRAPHGAGKNQNDAYAAAD